jgi:protein-disulfide isomerase
LLQGAGGEHADHRRRLATQFGHGLGDGLNDGELGVDAAKFDECLDSGRHADAVQKDLEAGVVAGVGGTPTMFINGRPFEGGVPLEALSAAIDEELAKK